MKIKYDLENTEHSEGIGQIFVPFPERKTTFQTVETCLDSSPTVLYSWSSTFFIGLTSEQFHHPNYFLWVYFNVSVYLLCLK